MRIGIIGAGRLGSALARRLGACGHEIMFGGDVSAQEAAAEIGCPVDTNAAAAAFGKVLILAVPFAAVDVALAQAGSLEARVIWSCVNALKPDLSGLAVGFNTSAAEEVARRAVGARVVGAIPPFAQAIGWEALIYDEGLAPTVFICGDDEPAKQLVAALVRDLGAVPADAGPLDSARLVEPAMMLMVRLAYSGVPRDLGLRLLERQGIQ